LRDTARTGTTPYCLTWTQSGNANANAARVSMVNMHGNVVRVNASTILSAIENSANTTTNGVFFSLGTYIRRGACEII
jgi:hypothetical protein